MSSHKTIYLPTPADIEQAKTASGTLSKYVDAKRLQLVIQHHNGEPDEFVLPGLALQILQGVLSEISKGNSICLNSHRRELNTEEAAELLNVSQSFLVCLLENGDIPFRKIGAHSRVLLRDILEYKESIDRQRNQALDDLAAFSQDEKMGY